LIYIPVNAGELTYGRRQTAPSACLSRHLVTIFVKGAKPYATLSISS
jgi:hypothetical protein